MNPSNDPHFVLGIPRTASLEEVKRAFRRLAMRWHPDRNPSAAAETEFKRIKAAYDLILDPEAYAQWLESEAAAAGHAPDAGSAAPAAAPAADLTQILVLTLEEAAQGCHKSVEVVRSTRCEACRGSGRIRHTHTVPCAQCKGIGRVRDTQRGSRRCDACAGQGYLRETDCADCSGSGWRKQSRTLSVKVPSGILQGERLRLAGQARHGAEDAPAAGDLYLEVRLATHPLFQLQQRDLHCKVPIGIFRLLLGGAVEVPTLGGTLSLEVLPYPAHGLDYRLPGQGFPKKHGRGAGDLVLHLEPIHPQNLGAKDRTLLERLDAALAEDLARRAPELAQWAEALKARQQR